MAEAPPSVLTLTVLGGPLAGQSFSTDEAVDEVLIGSDPDCRFVLATPGVSPIHARVWMDMGGLTVFDTRSPRGVFVNATRVQGQAPVRDGDVVWLGPPGQATSVGIQCRASGLAPAVAAPAIVEDLMAEVEVLPEPMEAAPSSDAGDFFFEDTGGPAEAAPQSASPDLESLIDGGGDFMTAEPVAQPGPAAPAYAVPAASDAFLFQDEQNFDAPAARPAEGAPDSSFFMDEPPSVVEPPEESFFVESAPPPEVPPPAPAPPPPGLPSPATTPSPAAPAALGGRGGTGEPPRLAAQDGARARAGAPRAQAPSAQAPPATSRPARRPPREAASASRPPARTVVVRGASRPSSGTVRLLGLAVLGVAVLAAVVYFVMGMLSTPKITALAPARSGVGQSVTLTGAHFAASAKDNEVRFAGKTATVEQASDTQLQVEVPELATSPGRDASVAVTVVVAGRESNAMTLAVYQAPRVHGISPNVAMPGEEVRLAGAGWGQGAKVRFGPREVEVLDVSPTALRVKVPADAGPVGQELPVTVAMGPDPSNAVSFVVGKLPLITRVEPSSAAPGDQVRIVGRGFNPTAAVNQVQMGGKLALVVSATGSELSVVVPRADPGEAPLELRLPAVEHVGVATLTVTGHPDPIDFRFVAEPFEDEPEHDHAVLSTGLGPAFVLSGTPGATAAVRALEAQGRLNAAAGPLRAALDADLRLKGIEDRPVLTLAGKDDVLLEVTPRDAAGYDEDWTKLGGRGGSVTPGRLAVWWEAVARDLVLLLVRGEKPRHAAALAPEGKVLLDLHARARKTVGVGVPREALATASPGLRVLAFRVPPSVTGPASAAAPSSTGLVLKLDGTWTGSVSEDRVVKYVTVAFAGEAGTITYRRALSLSIPLEKVEQPRRNVVSFLVQTGSGERYYRGAWDGQRIAGRITSDAAGTAEVGTFEIVPAK